MSNFMVSDVKPLMYVFGVCPEHGLSNCDHHDFLRPVLTAVFNAGA